MFRYYRGSAVIPAEGSKAQQGALLHGERAGRTLPERIVAPGSAITGSSGLLLSPPCVPLHFWQLTSYLKPVHPPQEKRLLQNVRQFEVPLQRYMALMDLQVSSSTSPLYSQYKLQAYNRFDR